MSTTKKYLFLIFLLLSVSLFSQTPGTKKWEYLTGSNVYSSPAIGSDGVIYIGSYDNKIYAIYPEGTKKWDFLTGGGIYSSPVIGTDGTIYIGSYDKRLYAINPDGTKKWDYLTTGTIYYSVPAIRTDGTIYVGSNDGKLWAINPDGTKKWELLVDSFMHSSPVIGVDGTIYVGGVISSKLYAINPDGSKKWEYLTGSSIYSSPGIGADGTIYIGSSDKKLHAVNPDGTKKWEYLTGNYIYSSPAIGDDGTIYVGSYDNKLYAINNDGTKKWDYQTGGIISFSSPAVGADGTVYVGSYDDKIYAINTDGTKKWEYLTGNFISSSPAIGADGTIYIGSNDYKLYAIYSSSNGLANSVWPKFKHDNFNKGQLTELTVSNNDFSNMVLPNQQYNFKINLLSNLNSNITINNIHINDVDFALSTSLPVTVVPGINQEVSLSLTGPENKWYKPTISIDFLQDGINRTRVYNLEGVIFLNDNSELAHTANQVMSVWKTMNKSNDILLNNTKGVIYRLLSDYPSAQIYFNIAMGKAINARYSYSGIMMNMGVVKSDRIIPDSANIFYASAMDVIQSTAASSVLAPQIYYNQAWEAYRSANYTSASTLALQTINHSMANAYLKAKAYALLGAIRFSQERTSEAMDAFNLAIGLDQNGPIGEMARANLNDIISTGIDQNTGRPDIGLYPNPSAGKITISIDNQPGVFNISLFNSVGEKVFSVQLSSSDHLSQELDLSHLVEGVYFIRIVSNDLVFTEKIVIIKN